MLRPTYKQSIYFPLESLTIYSIVLCLNTETSLPLYLILNLLILFLLDLVFKK